jgi:hypothetical protein
MDGPDQLDRNLAVLRQAVERSLVSGAEAAAPFAPTDPEPQAPAEGAPWWLARLLGFGDR